AESGPINYHLSLPSEASRVAPPSVALRPSAARRCNRTSAPAVTTLHAMDVLGAIDSGSPSKEMFCGAVVVVGSSNSEIARDDHLTPYGLMPGAFILANGARGLDLAGPLSRFPYGLGLAFVLAATVFVFLVFEITRRTSETILNLPAHT